jgi:unsaturated chondroitin disaccharide hydrolase
VVHIDDQIHPTDLLPDLEAFWQLSAQKIRLLEDTYDPAVGAPVITVSGRYTPRAWTEWTRGFQYGSALLQFDATGDEEFLEIGRRGTAQHMPTQLTHFGVHDHGFNTVSTYGNLLRLQREGRLDLGTEDEALLVLALKCSAAVQAYRWTRTAGGDGFIHSFNGRHSLFIDTMRSLRILALGHRLGHVLLDDNDRRVSLLERLVQHARVTAAWNVYYGTGRDAYDVHGRVAHESIFNADDGRYRCPSSQQGYSPLSTWTRGLAWAVCGFAEQLEFIESLPAAELESLGGADAITTMLSDAARATADYYLREAAADGIPYWDTGAPGLHRLPDWREQPADPFNPYEPVDSSAACIACQGLLRLGQWLEGQGDPDGQPYMQAGLTILRNLLDAPYLSTDPAHQGLILHSLYHRPNGWDFVPPGRSVPCGEASLWGDYHVREAALYVQRLARGQAYLTFWGPPP